MEMWQWIALFSAVSLNTIVNCWRFYLERKNKVEEAKVWLKSYTT